MVRSILLSLACTAFAASAQAAVIVAVTQDGSDVRFDVSGSLAVADRDPTNQGSAALLYTDSFSAIVNITEVEIADVYLVADGNTPLSFTEFPVRTAPTSSSGDPFSILDTIWGSFVYLAEGYVSGTEISATATFAGETFASLGLSTGTFQSELIATGDTITFQVGVAPVPLPGALILSLAGIGCLAALKRRTRA